MNVRRDKAVRLCVCVCTRPAESQGAIYSYHSVISAPDSYS